MPVKTRRPWVTFLIDNPVASVALMRALRKETNNGNSKKGDLRIPFERFLKEQDFE